MMMKTRSTRSFVLLAAVVLSGVFAGVAHAARNAYKAEGKCDGLPRLKLTTPPGFCVGLIADDFRFPRGMAVLPNGDLVIADMGGWDPNKGSLWLLRKHGEAYEKTLLMRDLDRPNGIVLGPDGKLYVGLVKRIIRFSPDAPQSVEDVVGGSSSVEPLPGKGRHPLAQMVFDLKGDLFVNIGSASDHCEKEDGTAPEHDKACPETEGPGPQGAIRKFRMKWPEGAVLGWENYATGLRNSMALAVHPRTGALWQAENSRDSIALADPKLNDTDLPHDELNLINKGSHYGWPYCYDNDQASPEYPGWDCRRSAKPIVLLPAHAAPLGMSFYAGSSLPSQYRNTLLIAFHGYRKTGHRLMAYPFTDKGMPAGKPLELISNWNASATSPMGAPVDVRVGSDGAVYMTEDRNGTVIKLVYSSSTP